MSESTTSTSAAAAVLRIPELLEIILLHLPQKDILSSQRVSRSFRQTTEGSIRLQRALFFSPDWNLSGRTYDPYKANNRPGRKPENNRLLRRAFPDSYPTVTLVPPTQTTPNELAIGYRRKNSEHWSWDVCIALPADKLPSCKPAVHYPEASWRRMYLVQPPNKNLHLSRRYQRSIRPALVCEEGMTMGELYEKAISGDKNWHESFISSDRDWHFEGSVKCSSVEE